MPVSEDLIPTDPTVDISVTLTESVLEAVEIVRQNWPGKDYPSRSFAIRELIRLGIIEAMKREHEQAVSEPAYQ